MGSDGRRGTTYRRSTRGGRVLGTDVSATWDPTHACRGVLRTDRRAKGNLGVRVPGFQCGEA
jgi:hypothetical protein